MESSSIVQVDTLDILVVNDVFDAGLSSNEEGILGKTLPTPVFRELLPHRDWKAQMIIFTLILTSGQRTYQKCHSERYT